jgi:hypothetical protein
MLHSATATLAPSSVIRISNPGTIMGDHNIASAVNKGKVEKSIASDLPEPPKFEDAYEHRAYLKGRLALAFRIFAKFGYEEGVAGHITVKVGKPSHPPQKTVFLGQSLTNAPRILSTPTAFGSTHLACPGHT